MRLSDGQLGGTGWSSVFIKLNAKRKEPKVTDRYRNYLKLNLHSDHLPLPEREPHRPMTGRWLPRPKTARSSTTISIIPIPCKFYERMFGITARWPKLGAISHTSRAILSPKEARETWIRGASKFSVATPGITSHMRTCSHQTPKLFSPNATHSAPKFAVSATPTVLSPCTCAASASALRRTLSSRIPWASITRTVRGFANHVIQAHLTKRATHEPSKLRRITPKNGFRIGGCSCPQSTN